MKNILIAIDDNPSAEKVAETGYTLARAMGAEATLVHVITETSPYYLKYPHVFDDDDIVAEAIVPPVHDIKKEAWKFLALTASIWAMTVLK